MTVEFRSSVAVMVLPNPSLENEEGAELIVNHRVAMDGTDYTYVKSGSDFRLVLTFENIGRGKLVEAEEFYRASVGEKINFLDHRGNSWVVVFDDAPLDFITDGKSGLSGGERQEQGSFQLVLVGNKK